MMCTTVNNSNTKKFKLTERDIKIAILNACTVLKSVCEDFECPKICEVKLTKASSYWANIKKIDGGKYYSVRVSNLIELIPEVSLAKRRLEETMIHELIHTMPGRFNHGPKFKSVCEKVNKKYCGIYKISSRTDGESYGIHRKDKPTIKYKIVCEHCGKEYYYSRKPKYHISEYKCTYCGSDKLAMKNY